MNGRPHDPRASATPEGAAWREVAPQGDSARNGATPERTPEPTPEHGAPREDALAELRGLLVSHERQRLAALEARPTKPDVEDVAALLPDAVRRRVARDEDLARALSSTIEGGLERSARRNPKALAEAIHPALGPAIRKAIQAALSQALESFNVALENSLSPRGLAWRLEALRTGVPFAEVVLLKSLVYRVEQVFLIHRRTGVLLAEAASPTAERKDPEVVSSMLAAIRDFARDSFGAADGDDLDRIDLAGLRITLVGNPDAVLAAVVRGTPPESLRARLEAALERYAETCAGAFQAFRGDTAAFEANAHLLEDCLGGEQRARPRSPLVRLVAPALGAALLVWLGASLWRGHTTAKHHESVLRALRREPGLVVLAAEERDGALVVRGLADAAARPVAEVAAAGAGERGLARISLDFAPYDAPGAAFATARLRARLAPEPGVEVAVDEAGLATIRGSASAPFVRRVEALAANVPGVRAVATAGLVDHDLARLEALVAESQDLALRFAVGRADLAPGDPLAGELAGRVGALGAAAARAGRFVRVTLTPSRHAAEGEAADLSLRRVAFVRAALAPASGAALLFEPALVVDGAVPIGDSGAVELGFDVLSGAPLGAAAR